MVTTRERRNQEGEELFNKEEIGSLLPERECGFVTKERLV